MSKITKYAFSDLYEMASGISSTKDQAGHGAPFVSFGTVFNNFFLPDEQIKWTHHQLNRKGSPFIKVIYS